MPGTALVLYALFVAVAFGWRTVQQIRRTGDSGFRGFSRGASRVERVAGALFALAAIVLLVAPALALWGAVEPLRAFDAAPFRALGLALVVLGFALAILAQVQMGDSWRIGVDARERTSLVRSGVFARVRNPIFTGMLAGALGIFLLTPTAPCAAGALMLWTAIELQVRRVEEPYLLATHGDAYLDYARAVGRFLPGIGRL